MCVCSGFVFRPLWLGKHLAEEERTGPEVIKLFSCPAQLSTRFHLLIKTKIPSDVVFIVLENVKMPTFIGI